MSASIHTRDAQMLTRLRNLAALHGITVKRMSEWHFHIQGALLVNYYPFSVKRTAYVANTTKSTKNVDMKGAIAMARELPPVVSGFKRKGYRAIKLKMLAKKPSCHWCGIDLTDETATIDHVIPLSRGGLDNDNNRKLACAPCNNKRGNDMPEIGKAMP